MTLTGSVSYPIVLGTTLEESRLQDASTSNASFISVKYNLKPPSIGSSIPGFMHSPSKYDSHWLLEYNAAAGEEAQGGSRSSVYGFVGSQTVAKDVDCILIWDDQKQCYTLDRIASSFAFRIDRGHTKMTEKAKANLSTKLRSSTGRHQSSALGLSISGEQNLSADDDTEMIHEEAVEEELGDEEEFARQLELGLEGFTEDEGKAKTSSEEDSEHQQTSQHVRTGLGLIDSSILREDVITPRGSPYIDRPKSTIDKWGGTRSQLPSQTAMQVANTNARSTPVVSPSSVTNSPRMTGLDSTLSSSNTWKPPPQRSNVAIAYEEEEESEDEEDDDEEEEDEEEDGDDDDDLDDYARQLESSLQS